MPFKDFSLIPMEKVHNKIWMFFRYQFWFGATNSDQYKLYSDIG